MAICQLYETEYDGNYKYSAEKASSLKNSVQMQKFKSVFPHKLKHTAKGGNKYDFCGLEDAGIKLSAKTTKKDGKVCPQVIGQPSRKRFCEFFGLNESQTNVEHLKHYIVDNTAKMLEIYCDNTFDCPILYYNEHKKKMLFVKLRDRIDWTTCLVGFTRLPSEDRERGLDVKLISDANTNTSLTNHITQPKQKYWNESTTLNINNIGIGEFQVHTGRDCIKFRWVFEKLLDVFRDHFDILEL